MAAVAAWLRARSRQTRIVAIAVVMTAAAIPLHLLVLHTPLPDPPLVLAGWAIALGFLITESFSLNLHVKGDAHSASFSEIPLLIGLAAASPTALIVGRAIGSGIALVTRNGSRGSKLAFNLALTYLDSALALVIYHSLLGTNSPASIAGLGVGALALGATLILNAGLVAVAILIANPGRAAVGVVRSLGTGAIMSGAASAVALGGLALFWKEPISLAIVLAAFVGLYGAFRGYQSLTRKFEDLEALHEFTSAVDGAADSDGLIAATLTQTRRLFSARFAEVVLSRGVESTATSSEGSSAPSRRPAPPAVIDELDKHDGDERLVAPLDEAPPAITEYYRTRGIEVGMIARMNGDGHAASLLVVGNPERSRFGKDELRLLETISRQARVAFERGRLVDRLRREMALKEHQALHDGLTGLPNRLHFTIVVEDALRRMREDSARVAVLLIDLDRFKEVNDTLGHQRGDMLLQELALRLSEAVGDDHMARLGGDEFGIVLRDVHGIAEVSEWARRIGALLQRPFINEGLAIQVSGSIGIAVAPDHGTDGPTLLRRADVAMYEAKAGGSTFEVYDTQRDRYSTRRLALAGELRDALEAGAVSVHYQPKAGIADGVVRGVEALARWLHPRHGLVPADEFITLAEQTGLIKPLTEHVLRVAFRDRARLRSGGHALGIAVNIASSSLGDPQFPDTVARLIGEHDVDPQAVTLEVTESTMMADSPRSRLVLASLDEIGVNLAIDDFGTGYSSLAHLSSLPVDEVKIDRSFVMGMSANERFAKIVTSTTALVHSLGLRVVAEGVENRGTWDMLREAGCDVAQGYFVSRPLGYTDLHAWLEAGAPLLSESRPRMHLGLAGG